MSRKAKMNLAVTNANVSKLGYVAEWAKPMFLPIPSNINFDSEVIPDYLKSILSYQIRQVLKLRKQYADMPVSQLVLDCLLNQWWENHRRQMKPLSKLEGWDWNNLSLIYSEDIINPTNLSFIRTDFFNFIRGYFNPDYITCRIMDDIVSVGYHDTYFYTLLKFISRVFDIIIDACDINTEKYNAYLTLNGINRLKETYESICFTTNESGARVPKILNLYQDKFAFKFGTLSRDVYNMLAKNVNNPFSDFYDCFNYVSSIFADSNGNYNVLIYSFMKYIGVYQTCSSTDNQTGPRIDTLLNKLIDFYFDLTFTFTACHALSTGSYELTYYDSDGRAVNDSLEEVLLSSQKSAVGFFKDKNRWSSQIEFKTRDGDGYETYTYGTFEQYKARLMDNCKGGSGDVNFILSFHPCDFITASLGTSWSSCHSFVNRFDEFKFPNGTGSGHSYSGVYHVGNFNFIGSNCIVAYLPSAFCLPFWLQPKQVRLLMWVSNDLDSIRMNYWYPSYQQTHSAMDTRENHLASSIRVVLQDAYKSYNNTCGTADWVKLKGTHTSAFSVDSRIGTYYGYDDPISCISRVKGRGSDIIYSGTVSCLNREDLISPQYINETHFCSYYCLKHDSNLVSYSSFNAIDVNGESILCKDFESIVINGVRYTFAWYKENFNTLTVVDKQLVYHALSYIGKDGIHYCINNSIPSNVHKCESCGKYYTDDMLYKGRCISCTLSDKDISVETICDLFVSGLISITWTERDDVISFLNKLSELHSDVRWVSGSLPNAFAPSNPTKIYCVKQRIRMGFNSALPLYCVSKE